MKPPQDFPTNKSQVRINGIGILILLKHSNIARYKQHTNYIVSKLLLLTLKGILATKRSNNSDVSFFFSRASAMFCNNKILTSLYQIESEIK